MPSSDDTERHIIYYLAQFLQSPLRQLNVNFPENQGLILSCFRVFLSIRNCNQSTWSNFSFIHNKYYSCQATNKQAGSWIFSYQNRSIYCYYLTSPQHKQTIWKTCQKKAFMTVSQYWDCQNPIQVCFISFCLNFWSW